MARYTTPHPEDADEHFLFEPTEDLDEGGRPQSREEGEHMPATIRTSDREELIQCIKRGQRTTWIPKPGLEALCAEVNAGQNASSSAPVAPQLNRAPHYSDSRDSGAEINDAAVGPSPSPATDALRRSLSALETPGEAENYEAGTPVLQTRAEIPTPRRQNLYPPRTNNSPPFWPAGSPPLPGLQALRSSSAEMLRRSRAPSLGSSLSSSFVMRIPTSPLVHATNNPTLDFSPRNMNHGETSKLTRRRTMPPNTFESLHMSSQDSPVPNFSRPLPYVQPTTKDGSLFSPSHRPRRSLSSFTYQASGVSQIPPWSRQRRSSLAADVSPRQHASMVGSFEESILRGRMSTPASKPFDFVAQIGVMGKGTCPVSLKCPAHVTVPFPAVFYNYSGANPARSISDDNPSPYVGNIDLEHNLNPPEEPRRRSRRSEASLDPEDLAAEMTKPENTPIGKALLRAAQEKQERASALNKALVGGAYRVPQKGQLQVIIKNPNKTAVKLFLVPYDLEGMLPGTKTFVRQRSYSSGPILEATTPEERVELAARDPLSAKAILRYLIHIKFCCTAKGRFYLYDSIRVVFANRVPDSKEGLRNEIQLPEPRFSPHIPSIASHSRSSSAADDKSVIFFHASSTPEFEALDGMSPFADQQNRPNGESEWSPTPFQLPKSRHDQNRADVTRNAGMGDSGGSQDDRTISPTPGFLPSTSSRGSPVPWPASGGSSTARGFSPAPVEPGHSLLSRKLRELNGSAEGPG